MKSERPVKAWNPPRDGKTELPSRTEPRSARCVSSEHLFGDAVELQIDHRGVFYRLRQTSLGKLILTK